MLRNIGNIYIIPVGNASNQKSYVLEWKKAPKIAYKKYNIKESDMRIKTATFSAPSYVDLTTGLYAVLIHSKFHENFGGIIIDSEYNEDTGMYDYQCQDFSRLYMGKAEFVGKANIYKLLIMLITRGMLWPKKQTSANLKEYKQVLSGLRAKGKYNQDYYEGNKYKGNPFDKTIQLIARDKTYIEVIRDIVFASLGYFDVWFNHKGVLQIDPISKTDWENTGLHLASSQAISRKFKFSTANAITSVVVNGSELETGTRISSTDLGSGINLSAFFGDMGASVSNQSSASKTTSNAVSNSKNKSTKTTTATSKNPYNKKKRKIWINADEGSDAMKNAVVSRLEKEGWKVHVGRTWREAHYYDYFNVSDKYSVYATIYNGVCAGTLREAYSSKIQNTLKNKGVTLVVMFDSRSWDDPSRHLKKFKYGDFTGASFKRAHDDGFSGSDPYIPNMVKFLKSNKAKYCCYPSAAGIVKQFLAGGYFAQQGIKV